jgi:hypothetical protein
MKSLGVSKDSIRIMKRHDIDGPALIALDKKQVLISISWLGTKSHKFSQIFEMGIKKMNERRQLLNEVDRIIENEGKVPAVAPLPRSPAVSAHTPPRARTPTLPVARTISVDKVNKSPSTDSTSPGTPSFFQARKRASSFFTESMGASPIAFNSTSSFASQPELNDPPVIEGTHRQFISGTPTLKPKVSFRDIFAISVIY